MQNNKFNNISELKFPLDFEEDEIDEVLFLRSEKTFIDFEEPVKNNKKNSQNFFLPLVQALLVLTMLLGLVGQVRADFDFKSAVGKFDAELNDYSNFQIVVVLACVWDKNDHDIQNNLDRREEFKNEISFDFRSTIAYLLFENKTIDELTAIFNSLVVTTLEKYPCTDTCTVTQKAIAERLLGIMFASVVSPQISSSPTPKEDQVRTQNAPLKFSEHRPENMTEKIRTKRALPLDPMN